MDESRYVLQHLVGEGGWAEVWEATDSLLNRRVAVKLFKPGATNISSALDHARALARVPHANIVQIHDVGVLPHPKSREEWNAVVMEYLEGPDLLELFDTQIRPQDADSISFGILEGLAALHAAGVVHRDLHAANIRIHKKVPKILDAMYRGTLAANPPEVQAKLRQQDVSNAMAEIATLLSRSGRQESANSLRRQTGAGLTAEEAISLLRAELSTTPQPSATVPKFAKGSLVRSKYNSDRFALRNGVVTDPEPAPGLVEVAYPEREPSQFLASSLELEEEQPADLVELTPVLSPLLIVSRKWITGRVNILNGPTFLLATATWWQELPIAYKHLFGWRGVGEIRAVISDAQPRTEDEARRLAEREVANAEAEFVRVDELWSPARAAALESLLESARQVRLLQDPQHRLHFGALYDYAVRAGGKGAALVSMLHERLPVSLY